LSANKIPPLIPQGKRVSIVTLIHHLVAAGQSIKQVFLLYTVDTQERAELTQGWLMDAPFHLPPEAIALLPVTSALSDDPIRISLAVQAAKQGLDQAIAQCNSADKLELNASSGTPVMKSAWSILQAAGYAPNSRVWQVRNPKEQRENQARVFQANLQVLRLEFDRKVIERQLKDYNYSGAAISLKDSTLRTPILEGLLQYGHRRLSLDFRGAKQAIAPFQQQIDPQWQEQIDRLDRQDSITLLKEAYFNAVIELKNQQFSNFLVRVSQFQEKALQYCVDQQIQLPYPTSFEETKSFWSKLQGLHPELYRFLKGYSRGDFSLKLDSFPNRPVLLAILEHGVHPLRNNLQALNTYCEQRNRYVHRFEGISKLDDAPEILKVMRSLLSDLGADVQINPFNHLNAIILTELNRQQRVMD
jgi:hypothetical protein